MTSIATARPAAPGVRYAARDTRGHRAQEDSVSQAVASLLALHRHHAALSMEDLTIVQCGAIDGQPATWFVYDSLVEYLDDQASSEIARWWAIVEAKDESAATRPRDVVLTLDQCRQAAANFGIDLSCPGCASRFYTGHSDGDHGQACATSAAQLPEIDETTRRGLVEIRGIIRRFDLASDDVTAASEAEAACRWIHRVLSAMVMRRALDRTIKAKDPIR